VTNHPLPNCGIGYSWWQRQAMLIRRCRGTASEEDHFTYLAHIGLLLSPFLVLAAAIHVLLTSTGSTASVAFQASGNIANGSSITLFVLAGFLVRWNFRSLRIIWPVLTAIVGIIVLFWMSDVFFGPFSPPPLPQVTMAFPYIMVLLGVVNTMLATTFRQCWLLAAVGLGELAFAIFSRQLLGHPWISDNLPILIAPVQIAGLLAFAVGVFFPPPRWWPFFTSRAKPSTDCD
jgi:hypothetical protein